MKPRPLRGKWYICVHSGCKFGWLAGPFLTHQEANGWMPEVRGLAEQRDPYAWFYTFGVARLKRFSDRSVGRLNEALGLPTVIDDPWS